jgi:hypothetical protein
MVFLIKDEVTIVEVPLLAAVVIASPDPNTKTHHPCVTYV